MWLKTSRFVFLTCYCSNKLIASNEIHMSKDYLDTVFYVSRMFTTNVQLRAPTCNIISTESDRQIKRKRSSSTGKIKSIKKRAPSHSEELLEYLSSKESLHSAIPSLPPKLLKQKRSAPDSLYLIDGDISRKFAKIIQPHLLGSSGSVIEVNPGLGLMTRELLSLGIKKLQLYESSSDFTPQINDLQNQFHDKINVMYADFFSIWKLAFQDKMDGGNRLSTLLDVIPRRAWTDGPAMKVVGSLTSLQFIKHLIYSLVFQTGLFMWGRVEFYLALPPSLYIHLTCDRNAGYLNYRATSIIFQLLFNHELLGKLPRKAFLPWETEHFHNKKPKLKSMNIDPDVLYITKFTVDRDLYEKVVPASQLQQLWYFIKHHFFSRKNRVIPQLEQWIPGCGPHLIAKGLTIYTEFGDLNPSEVLALFRNFSSLPEFPLSLFLTSMESNFLKSEPGLEDLEKDLDEMEDK